MGAGPSGSQTFTLTHQYLDDNPSGTPQDIYTIIATVTDDDTGSGDETTTVLIKNVDPTIEGTPEFQTPYFFGLIRLKRARRGSTVND